MSKNRREEIEKQSVRNDLKKHIADFKTLQTEVNELVFHENANVGYGFLPFEK